MAFGTAFLIVWLCTLVYVLSGLRLQLRLWHLKRSGQALEAPYLLHSLQGYRAFGWIMTDRYSQLGDDVVTRWSRRVKALFFFVLMTWLLLFLLVVTGIVPAS